MPPGNSTRRMRLESLSSHNIRSRKNLEIADYADIFALEELSLRFISNIQTCIFILASKASLQALMIFRACLAKDARTGLSAQPKAGAGIKHMKQFANVGALIIRIGFRGFLITAKVEYPPKPILIIKAPELGAWFETFFHLAIRSLWATISTLIGVISIVTLIITLVTKSHDPLSRGTGPSARTATNSSRPLGDPFV